ncbi:MAG TPA: hypothetical protein VFA89_21475 [Terriglobales bacterium]|nr:hypothetical protein [Terriglobales bacterium]
MLLIIYALLSLIPLLGIVLIVMQGLILTVDGLFLSLICLTISGIFAATALFELKQVKKGTGKGAGTSGRTVPVAVRATGSSRVEQGRVENVSFFESAVGQPNKSIVTLSDGESASRMLVLEGDVRNALPVGKKVAIACKDEGGRNILLDVSYV